MARSGHSSLITFSLRDSFIETCVAPCPLSAPRSGGSSDGKSWKEHLKSDAPWPELKLVGSQSLAKIDPNTFTADVRVCHGWSS